MSNSWYPFYPGDYSRDTAQLTATEHGIYRLLLDYYYSSGECLPLCLEQCSCIARAYHEHEKKAVPKILEKYFEKTERGWVNHRAESEINKMKDKYLKNKDKAEKAAKSRWHNKDAPSIAPSIQQAMLEQCQPQPQPQPQPYNKEDISSSSSITTLPDVPKEKEKMTFKEFVQCYTDTFNVLQMPGMLNNDANDLCNRHPRDALIAAFKRTAEKGGKTFDYFKKVLLNQPEISDDDRWSKVFGDDTS